MFNKKVKNSGITLIALVITIIVLLILAGVSIATLTGNNGLLKKAGDASKNTNKCKEVEQARLDIMSLITNKGGENPTEGEVKEIIENYFTSVPEDLEDLTQDLTTKDGGYNVKLSDVLDGVTIKENVIEKSTNKDESYVGCYADIDDDGDVDGIIYADMIVGNTKSGKWNNDNMSNYNVTKILDKTSVKDYVVSKKTYEGQTIPGKYKANDVFGVKDVIVPAKKSTGTKDRFFIMQLEDFTTSNYNSFYWYKNANIFDDFTGMYENDFGEGKAKTIKEINRWNAKYYGEQDDQDLWGVIQNAIGKKEENGIVVDCKWFIPSKSEWSAFGEELGINSTSSAEAGLVGDNVAGGGAIYWASCQGGKYMVWGSQYGNYCKVRDAYNYWRVFSARLSTTF